MIGFHSARRGRHIAEAIAEDAQLIRDIGISKPALQIFVGSPRRDIVEMTQKDIAEVAKVIRRDDITVVIHAAYVDMPWRGTLEKPRLSKVSAEAIAAKMVVAARIGATGVIVHLAKPADAIAQDAIELIAKYYSAEIAKFDAANASPILWLEINSFKASSTATTFADPIRLVNLFEDIDMVGLPFRIGLCLDSAHIHACGRPMSSRSHVTEFLAAIGVEKDKKHSHKITQIPKMLHLNDAAHPLGSGRDKHMPLGKGEIWKDYSRGGGMEWEESGLLAFMEWVRRDNIVVILERNEDDATDELRWLRKFMAED